MTPSPFPPSPFPPGLRKAGIVSPASPSPGEKFDEALHFLQAAGITPAVGKYALSGAEDPFFAAENEERLSDLNTFIADESIPLILAARGGYGSAWLLEKLDYENLRTRKKILCGYSDITALHLAMKKYDAGIPVASPMFTFLPEKLRHTPSVKSMKRALERAWQMRMGSPGKSMSFFTRLTRISPPSSGDVLPLAGKAAAVNLTLFSRLCGTKFLPDFRDWFLIIEEVGEPPRKIDFSFLQLYLSGAFTGCKGIILGDFTDCGKEEDLERVFRRLGEMTLLPIWKGYPFGHGEHSASLVWGEDLEMTPDGSCLLAGGEEWQNY